MEYSPGTSWLQQQHVSDVNDGRASTNDDWKGASSGTSGAGPSGVQPSMDLSDFGLDLSGEQFVHQHRVPELTPCGWHPAPSSSNPLQQQQQQQQPQYYSFAHHGNYFLAGTPGAYSTIPYTTSSWPAAASASSLPLSSYSSLNGATSATPTSATSSQSSSPPPPPQHLMIECAICCPSSVFFSSFRYVLVHN